MGMAIVNFQKFIMHIHDVVTRYNNCHFLCTWHFTISWYSLPCHHVVLMRVTLMSVYWWMNMIIEEIKTFAFLFPPMSESVSYVSCLMLNGYSVERILIIVFISIFVLGYYMYRPVLAHAHRNGQLL